MASAELVWPSWQDQTLRLQVSGVRAELLQRCMAKVGSCLHVSSMSAGVQLQGDMRHCHPVRYVQECLWQRVEPPSMPLLTS